MDHDQDWYEHEQEGGACGCFRSVFGYRLWRQHDGGGGGDGVGGEEGWMMNKLRKIREVSEVFAGPKWKTFMRKMSFRRKQKNRFQYDEHSYALNFNSGANSEDDDDDDNFDFPLSFSSRFSIPIRHTES